MLERLKRYSLYLFVQIIQLQILLRYQGLRARSLGADFYPWRSKAISLVNKLMKFEFFTPTFIHICYKHLIIFRLEKTDWVVFYNVSTGQGLYWDSLSRLKGESKKEPPDPHIVACGGRSDYYDYYNDLLDFESILNSDIPSILKLKLIYNFNLFQHISAKETTNYQRFL